MREITRINPTYSTTRTLTLQKPVIKKRVEDKFETYNQCRQMEKLIDELAKGRKMEKIMRVEKK